MTHVVAVTHVRCSRFWYAVILAVFVIRCFDVIPLLLLLFYLVTLLLHYYPLPPRCWRCWCCCCYLTLPFTCSRPVGDRWRDCHCWHQHSRYVFVVGYIVYCCWLTVVVTVVNCCCYGVAIWPFPCRCCWLLIVVLLLRCPDCCCWCLLLLLRLHLRLVPLLPRCRFTVDIVALLLRLYCYSTLLCPVTLTHCWLTLHLTRYWLPLTVVVTLLLLLLRLPICVARCCVVTLLLLLCYCDLLLFPFDGDVVVVCRCCCIVWLLLRYRFVICLRCPIPGYVVTYVELIVPRRYYVELLRYDCCYVVTWLLFVVVVVDYPLPTLRLRCYVVDLLHLLGDVVTFTFPRSLLRLLRYVDCCWLRCWLRTLLPLVRCCYHTLLRWFVGVVVVRCCYVVALRCYVVTLRYVTFVTFVPGYVRSLLLLRWPPRVDLRLLFVTLLLLLLVFVVTLFPICCCCWFCCCPCWPVVVVTLPRCYPLLRHCLLLLTPLPLLLTLLLILLRCWPRYGVYI